MTEQTTLITVQFNVHECDISKYALAPMPSIGIEEVLQVRLVSGMWEVTSTDPEAHKSWVGQGLHKQEAILDYLKARLGMVENEQ